MMSRASMGKQIVTAPATRRMAKGGKTWEGSKKDMAEDRKMAKSRGMTSAEWERSSADMKHDAPKKMAMGGKTTRGDGCAMKGHTRGMTR